MSVFRKKRTNGSLSENWYYEFKIGEQRYRGSTFRSSKKAANDFEKSALLINKAILLTHENI